MKESMVFVSLQIFEGRLKSMQKVKSSLGIIKLSEVPESWKIGQDIYITLINEYQFKLTNKQVCFLCGNEHIVSEYKQKALCVRCFNKLKRFNTQNSKMPKLHLQSKVEIVSNTDNGNIINNQIQTTCEKLGADKTLKLLENIKVHFNISNPTFTISNINNHDMILTLEANYCHICNRQLTDCEDGLINGYPLCDDCIDHLTSS